MLVAFCDQLFGELDVALLERDVVAVADPRVATLPFDGVERVRPGRREEAPEGQRVGCVDVSVVRASMVSPSLRRVAYALAVFGGADDVPPRLGRKR